jgi:xanthine permease XanP
MKRPPNLIYGLEDQPPAFLIAMNGLQHFVLISINLVLVVFVARTAGSSVQVVADLLAVALLVLSIGTLLQAIRVGPLGSGYMCPATFTAIYLSPSLLAAQLGGLPLAYGMTVFAGAVEAIVAPFLNRLRAIFPTEVSGLVIFMVGVSSGLAGLRTVLGPGAAPVSGVEWLVGALTLGSMAAFNIWGSNIGRMICALIGLVVGYVAAGLAGLFDPQTLAAMADAPMFGVPHFAHVSWSMDITLVLPFAIASFAAAMKAAGTITMCQRMNDAGWVRPEMESIRRGVLADGLSTVVSGALGGFGTNTSTPSVGLAAATGVTSRIIALMVAAIFFATAFLPKVAAFIAGMPRPVIVAALLFAMSFVITNGLQTMTSRLLDVRRALVLGLSIVAGVSVEAFPIIAQSAPRALAPIVGSSLVLSAVIALALNLLFRLGVRKTVSLTVQSGAHDHQALEDFFRKQGGMWGARPDVIDRALFGVTQLVDAVAENCWRSGPMTVTASFDEFNLDVHLSYEGSLLEFPDRRPSDQDIQESEDGVRRLAGFMLRRNADRVSSETKAGVSKVYFHFEH